MNKISVIMCIFNNEEFLEKSINCILNQTFKELELICIDKGSTDNSIHILNKISKKDKRVKIYEIDQHETVSIEFCLNKSSGKYVYFMNSTDILNLNALNKYYEISEKKTLDFLILKAKNYNNKTKTYFTSKKNSMEEIEKVVGKNIFNYKDLEELIFDMNTELWSKFYNKEFISQSCSKFSKLIIDESIIFWVTLLSAKRIYFYKECLYTKRVNIKSLSDANNDENKNFIDSITVLNTIINLFIEFKEFEKFKKKLYNHKITTIYTQFCKISEYSEEEAYKEIKKDFLKMYNTNYGIINILSKRNKFIFESIIKYQDAEELKLHVKNYDLNNKNKKLRKENKKLKNKNKKILTSNSWKITRPLREFNKKQQKKVNTYHKTNVLKKINTNNFSKITIAIKTANKSNQRHWGDYFYALSLKKSLLKKGFKVVVHEYDYWYSNNDSEDIVIVLRGLKKYKISDKHINIMWNISHPEVITKQEYNTYDIVFISSKKYANKINNEVNTTVKTLMQCTDPDIFYYKPKKELKTNILFIGNTRNVYRESVKNALKLNHDVSIYGKGWDKFLDEKYIKGEFVPNDILNQYYSSCKILLNDHWKDMLKNDFPSNRLFDALACGTFIISDKIPSEKTLFKETIICYNNASDLDRKINYYLDNENERNKISKKGQELVLKYHTFDNRVDTIIDVLKNLKIDNEG